MPNFIWLLQCVEDKMDVSQDFTDNSRIHVFLFSPVNLSDDKVFSL